MQRLSRVWKGAESAAPISLPKQLPKLHNWRTTVLGKGAFGTAVLPGPPNADPQTGEPIHYRRRPVKMMTHKPSYNKSVTNAEQMRSVRHIKYNFVPYKSHIKVGNLSPNLREQYFKGQSNNTPIYLAHMPHLGESIWKIKNSPELLEKISSIPVTIFMKEILKLFETIKDLADKGLHHNDLHSNNILINPDTGEINIIDFDLVKEFDREAVEKEITSSKDPMGIMKFFRDLPNTKIPNFRPAEYISERPIYYQEEAYIPIEYLNETAKRISFEKVKSIKEEIEGNGLENTQKKYIKQQIETYDLYNKLPGTLNILFNDVLNKPQYEEFRKFWISDIFPRMSYLRQSGTVLRLQAFSIQDIINLLQDYIDEKSPYSLYNTNFSRSRKAGGKRIQRKRKYTRKHKY